MSPFAHHGRLLLVAVLATLVLRALTPEGYMPGSRDSGLLFELCPEGLPPEIMRAIGGESGHHHHHHDKDNGESDGDSMSGTEQCPIGHMLASAFAIDVTAEALVPTDQLPPVGARGTVMRQRPFIEYRSRAPPT